ncbi:serine/threonine protein kinase [Actinoplanes rectilineatus]|uniref:serine/threonine protein kinase n=1 Tax=Actinoplanes rectilineatus TaxID=113571 RepID=UPI000698A5C3|nr:serine/threonine protein kinase [Actinoplanes rectilineatus]
MHDRNPHLIAERYRLVGALGQGGMGRVWSARDELLGRDVAIKELAPQPGLSENEVRTLRDRVIREARAIARLDAPNVVRVYDVVFHGGEPWIVMELVPSRSLYDLVRAEGPMPPERVARVGLGVLAALRAAHRAGLLHRDVKPANVLIAHDGRVVLTDFGLATAAGDSSMTSTGVVLGSPSYLAPERALDQETGPAADLWSLGATLYAAVEGKPPYAKSSPMATLAALATELPPPPARAGALRPALIGLLQRDPRHRADAETAERLLQAALGAGAAGSLPGFQGPTFAEPGAAVTPAPARPIPLGESPKPPAPVDPLSAPSMSLPVAGRPPAPRTRPQADPDATPPAITPEPPPGRRRNLSRRSLVILLAAALVGGGVAAQPAITEALSGPDADVPAGGATWVVSAPGPAGAPVATADPTGRPSRTAAGGARPGRPVTAPPPSGTTPKASVTTTAKASGKPAAATTTTTAASSGRVVRSIGTGTCLHAPAVTGRLELWSCTGSTAQRFTHPADGTMRVRGKCAQISSTSDGTVLQLATCTGGISQQWDYNSSDDLVNLWAIKCVDVPDASTADGVPAQIWECTGADHQKWTY